MSNIIDFLPILRIFPSEMRSRAIKLHRDLVEIYGGMIIDIQERMKRGDQVPDCLAKTLLLVKETENLDDLDVSMMAAAFMIGGVETVRLMLDTYLPPFTFLSPTLACCTELTHTALHM